MAQTIKMFRFRHQGLDVYRAAIEFIGLAEAMDRSWFRIAERRNQLTNAADSIALNIAEGSAQTSQKARQNHYRIAMGSAAECDAVLEILAMKGHSTTKGRDLLARIGAMLCRMCGPTR